VAIGDVKTLHHLWLVVEEGRRVSRDDAKLGGFEKALREKRTSAGQFIISTGLIRLPFPVETEITDEPQHWSDSNTSVFYGDLPAARDIFSGAVGQKSFKDISSPSEKDRVRASTSLQSVSYVTDAADKTTVD